MAKDQMAPNASPGGVSKKSGVRRVNNVPVFILGGVVIAFLVIMMLVMGDRAAKQNAAASTGKDQGGNTTRFAKAIVGNQADGIVQPAVPPLPPPKPVEKPKPVETVAAPPPPAPPPAPAPSAPVEDKEAALIRMAKLQMFKDAVKASPTVKLDMARASGSSPGGKSGAARSSNTDIMANLADMRAKVDAHRDSDPTATYKSLLAAARGLTPDATGSGGGGAASSRNSMSQFSQSGQGDRWKLNSKLQAPRSPYELRAGFVIPATLISGINSDLPGKIIAQVAQDVYDTPTGKYLLIPQGSRLLGEYSSEVMYGQERVLVGWQRIIFPDGKALDIGAMPGSDSAGYAGFNDLVNNHYVRLFGSAILMSGIVGMIAYSQDQANYNKGGYGINPRPNINDAFTQALGQQLGQVSVELIRKNMNIAPTLEIRPGYRFNVVVIKDLTFFRPYREFDYSTANEGK